MNINKKNTYGVDKNGKRKEYKRERIQ